MRHCIDHKISLTPTVRFRYYSEALSTWFETTKRYEVSLKLLEKLTFKAVQSTDLMIL